MNLGTDENEDDASNLAEAMSRYSNFVDKISVADIPCSPSLMQAAKSLRSDMQIDARATKIYGLRLQQLKDHVLRFVPAVEKAGDGDVPKPVIDLNTMMQLCSWSDTPHFDKSAYELLGFALTMCSMRVEAKASASSKLSWKAIPAAMSECYKAGLFCVTPGSDATVPKLTFVTGDKAVALTMYRICEEVFRSVEPAVQKLRTIVTSGPEE